MLWEREGDWVWSRAWAAPGYLGLRSLKCYLMCGNGDRGGFFPLFVVLVRRELMHSRHWFHPFIWLNQIIWGDLEIQSLPATVTHT